MLLVLALAQIASVGPAKADTDAGIADLSNGDYIAAMEELLPAAKAGDARAQANLAVIYHYGLGIAANFTKAFQWYHAAALQGSADGQIGLAVLYAKGQGVPVDLAIAHMWLTVAYDSMPLGPDRDRIKINRDFMAEQLTTDQLKKSTDLIQAWYRDHTAP